ncbi:MAG: excinuclease ABC subunit UvrA [Deltaproteobacteria bacterium]|nr:excinuclease ABC subunit UvrA [Deltaproteobacteria bacterium]
MTENFISIVGAKEHNLKNIHLKIPREKFVVITGVSGSGKSSLAFDTLYAEGQRRYVESLSTYARQFLELMPKPDVESIDGLSPAIAIEQRTASKNPRSTVGTVTEIYDYLRLLFARIGHAECPQCHQEITSRSVDQMVEQILKYPVGGKIAILAPIVRNRKGEYQKELYELRQQGFVKVKVDGESFDLSQPIHLDKNKKHSIDVYIDRLIIKDDMGSRLSQSLETALSLANNLVKIEFLDGEELLLSSQFACSTCGTGLPELEPRLFSFNSSVGACAECGGIGFKDITSEVEKILESGTSEDLEEVDFFHETPCPGCQGGRLKKEALCIKIKNKTIVDVCQLSLFRALEFFKELSLTGREVLISERMLKEIKERLSFLINVGVGYLTLNRLSATLSGGESQRIRLATQIGSALTGVLYILDEPSIGLHPQDNQKLIDTLKALRDQGNTILVVEHDEETIRCADHIIDLGPGAGTHGGAIVSQGDIAHIMKDPLSLTGAYLNKQKFIPIPPQRRKPSGLFLELVGAQENNLKNISLKIPLGLFVCITGISGSGKSSLILDTLYRALANHLHNARLRVGKHAGLHGIEHIDSVIDIDQSPIGRTPRSNPATYTGIFSLIRSFFAGLPESKVRGYTTGRYSFNVAGGRCETCGGAGLIKIEMHFLPNVFVQCEICQGQRYNRETLEIRYKEKNISEVLSMTIEEALIFFDRIPQIKSKLQTLLDVGMGYVHLGQQATTLSGGEAQRIKLARELSKRNTGKTLFILDEPTTGLHFEDIQKLLKVLHQLVGLGNTVIVIEHNLEVIKSSDTIIDMGPEGGEKGGYILAEGSPEELAKHPTSLTGHFLKKTLNFSS